MRNRRSPGSGLLNRIFNSPSLSATKYGVQVAWLAFLKVKQFESDSSQAADFGSSSRTGSRISLLVAKNDHISAITFDLLVLLKKQPNFFHFMEKQTYLAFDVR